MTPSDPLFERPQLVKPPLSPRVKPTRGFAMRRYEAEYGARMPSIRATRSVRKKLLRACEFMSAREPTPVRDHSQPKRCFVVVFITSAWGLNNELYHALRLLDSGPCSRVHPRETKE
jgi:hypothetical protein